MHEADGKGQGLRCPHMQRYGVLAALCILSTACGVSASSSSKDVLSRFYFVDPAAPARLIAVDAGGRQQGIVDLGEDEGLSTLVSPDGSRILRVKSGIILDGQGQRVGVQGPVNPMVGETNMGAFWADDNRHLCEMRLQSPVSSLAQLPIPEELVTWTPGSTKRVIAQVGRLDHQEYGLSASLDACSYQSDRALVEEDSNGTDVVETWLVHLSTGTVSHHQTYAGTPNHRLTVSRDARFTAENYFESAGDPATIIRDVDSGSELARYSHMHVSAFSWDDSLAIAQISAPRRNDVELLDYRSGRVVWRYSDAQKSGVPLPERYEVCAIAGGNSFVIRFWDAPDYMAGGPLTIVHGDESTQTIPGPGRLIGCRSGV
jgi:hypothetical protein